MVINQQSRRINDVLHQIHAQIDQPLNATQLAATANWSSFHFHRRFKAVIGESVNHYIRHTRLEMAANQLLFLRELSITQVMGQCGFQSQASFCHAFKQRFGCTPSTWRDSGYQIERQLNQDSSWNQELIERSQHGEDNPLPNVRVHTLAPRQVVYKRHLGYDRSIRSSWEKLQTWSIEHDIDWEALPKLGLHHSNADIIPLEQCRYVACVEVSIAPHQVIPLNQMTIPGGIYASFEASGVYGDLLPLLHKFYHQWLPSSGYNLAPTPGYADYRRCHFIDPQEQFDLSFHVPLRLA